MSLKISKDHAGKWIAAKGDKIVDSAVKLDTLMKKVDKRSDKSALSFALLPKNFRFAG